MRLQYIRVYASKVFNLENLKLPDRMHAIGQMETVIDNGSSHESLSFSLVTWQPFPLSLRSWIRYSDNEFRLSACTISNKCTSTFLFIL